MIHYYVVTNVHLTILENNDDTSHWCWDPSSAM